MSLPVPDRDQAIREMHDSSARWADLLRSTQDANQNAIGYWSVGQVASHTAYLFEILDGMLDGTPSPIADHRRMAEHWDRQLDRDRERELKVLADRIEERAASIGAKATQDRWTELATWHGGIPMPVYSLAGIVVSESEMHGYDVAAAGSRGWKISRAKALVAMLAIMPSLPNFLREETPQGLTANWQLSLRGGPTVYFLLDKGRLEITDTAPARIDCKISADPVEYLLVGYGRKSQWGPVITGKIAAYGRKPWLSLTMAKLFITP